MSNRNVLAVLGLAVLLVTAGCLGGAQAAGENTDSPGRTVDVSASETLHAAPDQVVLHVAIEASASSASAVRADLDAAAADLTSSLEAAGVAPENVVTARYDLSVVRDREQSSVAYRGVHGFRVTSDAVENAGALVDVALANGANRVDAVRFTLSADARQELYRDALAAALDTAREDATVIADASNLTVTDAYHVSASNVRYGYYEGSAASTSIREGTVAVTATVAVTYTAE